MSSTLSRISGYGVGSPKIALSPAAIIAHSDPSSSNYRFPLTQQWLNRTTGSVFMLVSVEGNSAVWQQMAGSDFYPTTPYVVGLSGDAGYQTIQSAVNAAEAAGGGIVVVQPGTYTENLTLFSNVHIMGLQFADAGGGVNIVGTHTPPNSGGFAFQYVQLQGTSAIFSSSVAGSAHLIIGNAAVSVTNGFTFNLPNWTGKLESYDVNAAIGTADGYINNTGGSTIAIFSCSIGSGTSNVMTVSGQYFVDSISIYCPVNFVTGSVLFSDFSTYNQGVTFSNNSTGYERNGTFVGGSNAGITMSSSAAIEVSQAVISSSHNPAIAGSGAGVLSLGGNVFTNNALVSNTLTVAYLSMGGVLSTANTPGASPQIVNARTGQVIFTDTIANGAYGTLTLTNSIITSNSIVIPVASCATANSALHIVQATPGSGSIAFRIFNAGSASTADNILINFWVLN